MTEVSARIRFARRVAQGDSSLRLYAILDGESCARRGVGLEELAMAWRSAGVELVQYRDKAADRHAVLANAAMLRDVFPPGSAFLLLNDYPEMVAMCGFDGAHVGQGDAGVEAARALVGADRILGVSTHSADQAMAAGAADVDYVAVGPVYATATKADAAPVVGVCGVQAAKAVVRKPLVAIGGIGPAQGRAVLQAGADAVALIGALLPGALLPGEPGRQVLAQRAGDILAGLK